MLWLKIKLIITDLGEANNSAFWSFPIFQASWSLHMIFCPVFGYNFRIGFKISHNKFR